MQSILFVCTANQCRSPIAAELFKRLLREKGFLPDEWTIESAGTWTKNGLPPILPCQKLAQQFDIDLSSHRTRSISDLNFGSYDLVVVMEQGHYEALYLEFFAIREKLFLLSTLAGVRGKSIPDPLSRSTVAFADTIMREMAEYIRLAFGPICLLALKADPSK